MIRVFGGIAIFLIILAAGIWLKEILKTHAEIERTRAEIAELRMENRQLLTLAGVRGGCQADEFLGVVCWDDNDHPNTITNAQSIANEFHTEFPVICQRKD